MSLEQLYLLFSNFPRRWFSRRKLIFSHLVQMDCSNGKNSANKKQNNLDFLAKMFMGKIVLWKFVSWWIENKFSVFVCSFKSNQNNVDYIQCIYGANFQFIHFYFKCLFISCLFLSHLFAKSQWQSICHLQWKPIYNTICTFDISLIWLDPWSLPMFLPHQ